MTMILYPGTDVGRISLLRNIIAAYEKEKQGGHEVLFPDFVTKMKELLTEYEQKSNQVSVRIGEKSAEVSEKNEALSQLIQVVRDFWEVLRRRTSRLNYPPEILRNYLLPIEGVLPNPGTQKEWLEYARAIVEGEKKTVEAGYPPMQNPSAEEVRQAAEKFEKEFQDVIEMDKQLDALQEDVKVLRTRADAFIRMALDQIQIAYADKDGSDLRRIIRRFGYVIKMTDSEEALPEENVQEQPAKPQ